MDWEKFCGSCKRQGLCCGIEAIYATKEEEKRIRKAIGANGFTNNGVLKKSGRKCVFQNGKLCNIYKIRPLDCRAYPIVFWSDAGKSRVSYFLDLDCPKATDLTKKDLLEIERSIRSKLKGWTKKDLYKYDVGTYWKPEKLKKKTAKSKKFPFGTDL